jgi:hypothetical protein
MTRQPSGGGGVIASRGRRSGRPGEVLVEKRQQLGPGVGGLLGAMALGIHEVQEGMAGAFVHMEFVRLAVLAQLRVDLLDVIG